MGPCGQFWGSTMAIEFQICAAKRNVGSMPQAGSKKLAPHLAKPNGGSVFSHERVCDAAATRIAEDQYLQPVPKAWQPCVYNVNRINMLDL
jgi:hypothetical protein